MHNPNAGGLQTGTEYLRRTQYQRRQVQPGTDRHAPLGSGTWADRHCYGSLDVIYSPRVAEKRAFTAGVSRDIDKSRFVKCNWHNFYRGAQELIPGDSPKPRGNVVTTHSFVDADHVGNWVTRRLQTGILIFVSRAPMIWYSKQLNTVETSTFGSEIVAMKISVELIEALKYKLIMFGILIDGLTHVFCNNEAMTKNTIYPEPTLKKKHYAIAYHRAREAVVAGTIRVTKEEGKTNLADVLTKPLPQITRDYLCNKFMY